MPQVGEASFFQYHPVVEAHVRLYGVLHEQHVTEKGKGDSDGKGEHEERAFFQTRVM